MDELENNLPDISADGNESGLMENGEIHGDSNFEV